VRALPSTPRGIAERAPWWTAADQAELDVLIHAFVDAVWAHRARCSTCASGGLWCVPLREALEAVLDWRWSRLLRSKAAWLREREWLREQARDA
jgi:hypothetical protein